MMKRLDDIENWYDVDASVSPDDFGWLIGQVDRLSAPSLIKLCRRLHEEKSRHEAELELYRKYFKKVHDELEKEDSAGESIENILRLNTQLLISLAALEAAEECQVQSK
ncbi:hypothetical protein [Bacillus haynesii]|uniref:hypothetical protein n=1 Tax=Bacillus haynesii TaxID=1925021 RepID=UPI001F619E8D|nr:hypothetical protein [Bacillus haynesii]MCI4128209.1 hypothetical protein [Bacillus haynesii]